VLGLCDVQPNRARNRARRRTRQTKVGSGRINEGQHRGQFGGQPHLTSLQQLITRLRHDLASPHQTDDLPLATEDADLTARDDQIAELQDLAHVVLRQALIELKDGRLELVGDRLTLDRRAAAGDQVQGRWDQSRLQVRDEPGRHREHRLHAASVECLARLVRAQSLHVDLLAKPVDVVVNRELLTPDLHGLGGRIEVDDGDCRCMAQSLQLGGREQRHQEGIPDQEHQKRRRPRQQAHVLAEEQD